MNSLIPPLSRLFDLLLAPLGHGLAAFDLLVWPVLAGIGALLVYKRVSNQAGITRAKQRIQVHLLEVVLFKDDLLGVLKSTAGAIVQNGAYVGHNLLPMVVMFAPMMALLVQLVANYAYAPEVVGQPVLLTARLDPQHKKLVREVKLTLPPGVKLDAPPVRTADGEVVWRLLPDQPGDHVLKVQVGGQTFDKHLAVGGGPRKVPATRTKTWEAILYPGEDPLPSDGPLESLAIPYPNRALPFFPDGEGGILGWFLVSSLVAGFALKDRFGVTL